MKLTSTPEYADVVNLLSEATTCMLMRCHVPVTHDAEWKRPEGWPLPTVRVKGPGEVTQEYRAMAVIEWCEFKLDEPRRVAQAQARVASRWGSAE